MPLFLEDLVVGHKQTTKGRTVTEADIVSFTGLSGDFNSLHTDEEFAKQTPYGTRVAQGLLGASIASGLITQTGSLDGTALGIRELKWKFIGPIKAGDTIKVVATILATRPSSKPGR